MSSNWLSDDDTEYTYYDSDEFKDYVNLVETQLKSTDIVSVVGKKGITLGELHRQLGDKARREWTMDAINYIDHIAYEGHPSRYWVESRPAKVVIRIGGSVILEEVGKREKWEAKKQAELS